MRLPAKLQKWLTLAAMVKRMDVANAEAMRLRKLRRLG